VTQKRSLSQILKEMYPNPADVPIWVWVADDIDVVRRTTLGEYWGDIYDDPKNCVQWEEIFK
jgi:hypothetical protein